ncbi:MAG: inverse autotransporter beta domain-containing protein [Desulfomonile tiedjei]|uniref:Inverse autotransporter beta domain-containing protein n=1 Tax=Desulfomonile tiedjei TaxID=2358 RepID=A0A9D6V1F7_9BACT|nr:inverse autotransporter beta domain-containing protein [Desulfomonile tiedjei]
MRTNAKVLLVKIIVIIATALFSAQQTSVALGAPVSFPEHEIQNHNLKRHPGKIAPSPLKPLESEFPDLYIEQSVKLGLKKVLPEPLNRNVGFSAGYDRWKKIPTMKVDYLFPLKAWPDKTIFFQPRLNLDRTNECFSFGLGFRQILTSDLMVGFHAFHDWVRPRFSQEDALKQAGVGFELSALPGRHSDLTFSANLYLPINERISLGPNRDMMIREALPTGADAKVSFLLPAMVDYLDIRLEGQANSYKGERTDTNGYKAGLTLKTRDGMFNATFEHGRDSRFGENYKVEGKISLTFDWAELFNGGNPFSAPYKTSSTRYARKLRDSLHDRVFRKYDLPADKNETRYTLMADTSEDTLFLSGGFVDLPNATLTIQTSRSPWEDFGEVTTNEKGAYSGTLKLERGIYQLRLVHKPTGRVSNVKTVVVDGPPINKE